MWYIAPDIQDLVSWYASVVISVGLGLVQMDIIIHEIWEQYLSWELHWKKTRILGYRMREV